MCQTDKKLREECGVFGVYGDKITDAAAMTYYGLFALQHRGQQSCGIVANNDGVFSSYKDNGLVNDVFTQEVIESLGAGSAAVGHVRYGVAGTEDRINAQPIVVNHVKGRMAVAHNGCLVNYYELREELELKGAIFHTKSDTEVISYIITSERLGAPSIEQAVNAAMDRLEGAYSIVVMSPSKLIAARDPHGFHPLCYGRTNDGAYIVASESCALDAVGATLIREIKPGEIVIFDREGVRFITNHCDKLKPSFCVFEYIYFARPDSVCEGCSVHSARLRAGAFLALEHPVQADVVIGVPDSGLDAAMGYSRQSGIPYGLGFIKNKYIGRTFIQPTQADRENLVRIKLNPVAATVAGKRVVLIDDSIVRGTTSARIVKLLRDAGATEVHMRSSAPPFTHPCYFGTDIDSTDKLIACKYTQSEIAEKLGVDSLGYLSVENVTKLCDNTQGFCTGCFTGVYPTAIPKSPGKDKFERRISEEENV